MKIPLRSCVLCNGFDTNYINLCSEDTYSSARCGCIYSTHLMKSESIKTLCLHGVKLKYLPQERELNAVEEQICDIWKWNVSMRELRGYLLGCEEHFFYGSSGTVGTARKSWGRKSATVLPMAVSRANKTALQGWVCFRNLGFFIPF